MLRILTHRWFSVLVSLVLNVSSARAEVVALLLVMFTWCLETRTWQIVALLNGMRRGKVVQAKGAARQGRGHRRRPGGQEAWGVGGERGEGQACWGQFYTLVRCTV